jgi:hypothetical protein
MPRRDRAQVAEAANSPGDWPQPRRRRPNASIACFHRPRRGAWHRRTLMGGDVMVTSEPGKGSAFTVGLPGDATG